MTQQELEDNFEERIEIPQNHMGLGRKVLLTKVKDWYNGYSWDGRTFVYNPSFNSGMSLTIPSLNSFYIGQSTKIAVLYSNIPKSSIIRLLTSTNQIDHFEFSYLSRMKLWQRHFIFWFIIYIAWSYMKTSGSFWRPIFLINILNVGIYIAAYYTLRHYQLPKLYNQRKWLLFGLSLLITSVGFYVIWRVAGILWMDDLYYRNTRDLPFWNSAQYLTQTVQFYSPAIALLAIDIYNDRQREKLRLEQLEKEKLATELKFLKAQINPHFLFNTLNNLYSFVVTQSPKAPDIILQLSAMLDYVLYRSQKESVPLQEELNCIENFLKLEQIRYGERLKVDYQTDGDLTQPIAPLLLLSIVENAFKHGASGDIDEPEIKINIHADIQTIQCEVWNTKSRYEGELNDAYKEGIGLKNIKRQLDLVYPEQHELEIKEEEDAFCVNLKIEPFKALSSQSS